MKFSIDYLINVCNKHLSNESYDMTPYANHFSETVIEDINEYIAELCNYPHPRLRYDAEPMWMSNALHTFHEKGDALYKEMGDDEYNELLHLAHDCCFPPEIGNGCVVRPNTRDLNQSILVVLKAIKHIKWKDSFRETRMGDYTIHRWVGDKNFLSHHEDAEASMKWDNIMMYHSDRELLFQWSGMEEAIERIGAIKLRKGIDDKWLNKASELHHELVMAWDYFNNDDDNESLLEIHKHLVDALFIIDMVDNTSVRTEEPRVSSEDEASDLAMTIANAIRERGCKVIPHYRYTSDEELGYEGEEVQIETQRLREVIAAVLEKEFANALEN